MVYGYVHSEEVELVFNKPVQLDHFFYKVIEQAANA